MEQWKHRTVSPTLLLYFSRLHKLFVSTVQMQAFVELSDNSSSINPQQTVKICNSAVAQHSIVPSPAVCALNGALFGLSWLVRFTFEFIQCCQSGWPKTTALKNQFPHSLYRNHKSLGRITQKPRFLNLIQRLLKQPSSKHFDICQYDITSFWIFFKIFIFISCDLQTWQRLMLLSMAKWLLLLGLKCHGGWLIFPQPHTACGCDTAINSGPRFNLVTKERSVAPARFQRGVWRSFCEGEQGGAGMFSSRPSFYVLCHSKS